MSEVTESKSAAASTISGRMSQLLAHLVETESEERLREVQIAFLTGLMAVGNLKKSPVEGIYMLMGEAIQGDRRMRVEMLFPAETVFMVTFALKSDIRVVGPGTLPPVVGPNGGGKGRVF